jgi:hypothetical protein
MLQSMNEWMRHEIHYSRSPDWSLWIKIEFDWRIHMRYYYTEIKDLDVGGRIYPIRPTYIRIEKAKTFKVRLIDVFSETRLA